MTDQDQSGQIFEIPEVQSLQFMSVCVHVWHGPILLSRMIETLKIDATDQELIDWYLADLRHNNTYSEPLTQPFVTRGSVMTIIGTGLAAYSKRTNGEVFSWEKHIQPLKIEFGNPSPIDLLHRPTE